MTETKKGLDRDEGYKLTKNYVQYFWRSKKFYSLARDFEEEDAVSKIYLKFLEQGLFEKYNPNRTTKKYFIMSCVKRSLIDMLRIQKEKYSLEQEDQNGIPLIDKIQKEGLDTDVDALGRLSRNEIIEALPAVTDSQAEGESPLLGKCEMSLRNIALHLEQGYSAKDIAKFFCNPHTGSHISPSRIHQLKQDIREIARDFSG